MIGSTLSHYKITAELGRGGMGIVYRAQDTKLNREVALKLLPSSALATEEDRARFYREAQAAAQLHHTNIATVFEIDEAVPSDAPHGTLPSPFIVMEYIEGETLDARIKKGPLKLKEAVRLASEIAEALKLAHSKDIVHRDIKSANVMLTGDMSAKVLDFGLAKTAQSTQLTRMGSTLGTIAYMSPEQARGEEVDGRADLWALGITLYEMVSGLNPFGGEYEQAVVYSILNNEPEPLSGRRTGVPLELERIVNKLLAKDAERRYQSAAGLISDLKGIEFADSKTNLSSTSLNPVSGRIQEPGPTESVGKRFSTTTVGLAVLLALFLGVIGGNVFLGSSANSDFQAPVQRITTSFEGLVGFTSPVIPPDERYLVFSAIDSLGETASYVYDFDSGEIVSRYPQSRVMYPDISPDGRWVVLSGIGADMQTFLLPDGNPTVISRVGEWTYWESNESLIFRLNGDLYRMSASGGEPSLVAVPDSSEGHNRLWPSYVFEDGTKAFITAGGVGTTNRTILYMDLESSEYQIIQKNAHQAKYLNSGHLMYLQGGRLTGQLVVQPFDKDKGELYGLPVNLTTEEITWVNWNVSEEGTAIYSPAVTFTGTITWMDMSGFISEQDLLADDSYSNISLSPAGDRVLISKNRGIDAFSPSQVISLDSSRPPFLISADVLATSVSWSADGSHVYFANTGQSGTLSTIYKVSVADGGRPEQIAQIQGAAIERLSVSPDESFILYDESLSDDLYRFAVADQSVSPWIETSDFLERDPTVSPSGRYVAYIVRQQSRGNSSSGIVVSDIEGNEVWNFTDPSTFLRSPQWSPDGNYLYFSKSSGELVRVRVSTDGDFSVEGNVQTIGKIAGLTDTYSVHPDGERIMILSFPELLSDEKINFIFNFGEEAKRVAPTQ